MKNVKLHIIYISQDCRLITFAPSSITGVFEGKDLSQIKSNSDFNFISNASIFYSVYVNTAIYYHCAFFAAICRYKACKDTRLMHFKFVLGIIPNASKIKLRNGTTVISYMTSFFPTILDFFVRNTIICMHARKV